MIKHWQEYILKKSRGNYYILGGVALIGIAAAFVVILGLSYYIHGQGEKSKNQISSSLCGKVPEPYYSIFNQAAQRYQAPSALIAAIFSCGEHGGGWPNSNGPWASSSKGAQGPFQFMPDTWTQYGVDGNGDGKKDVQNLTDAAYGAANYLAANIKSNSGSYEEKIKKAIYAYNHAQWYVDKVYNCYLEFSCTLMAGGCDNPNKLMNIYGSSSEEVQKHLVSVDFMGKTVQFHEKAAPYLRAVVNDIKDSGTTYKFRRVGTYSWRDNVNNPGSLSLHSFGIAIDINDDVNCNGCTTSDFPPEVINAFKNHGFRWGGDYRGKKDPMHFEWLGYDCGGNLIIK